MTDTTSITTIHIDPLPKAARIRLNPRKPVCCQHVQIDTIKLGDGMQRVMCLEEGCGHEWISMPLRFSWVKP